MFPVVCSIYSLKILELVDSVHTSPIQMMPRVCLRKLFETNDNDIFFFYLMVSQPRWSYQGELELQGFPDVYCYCDFKVEVAGRPRNGIRQYKHVSNEKTLIFSSMTLLDVFITEPKDAPEHPFQWN